MTAIPENQLPIHLPDTMVNLALLAAKLMEKMPTAELLKLEAKFQKTVLIRRPKASVVLELSCLVGFTFIEQLREAQKSHLAAQQPQEPVK